MLFETLNLAVISTEKITPNTEKEADLYARIGYRLEDAVADLVDNSIDAKAANVLIRFQTHKNGIHSLLIADDGEGMDIDTLREAMRIGSDTGKGASALGKYGTGLKAASLSQAGTVTVLSRKGRSAAGMRWEVENIRRGWVCEVLDPRQSAAVLDLPLAPAHPNPSGTVVIWERLEHLRASDTTVERVIQKSRKKISDELGIRFHRLIEAQQVAIWIDEVDVTESEFGEPVPVLALNPFDHGGCGRAGYPMALDVQLRNHGSRLTLDLHIWPPKSGAPGYRLGGGKVASRQGFYFYRNDRLIQAGGWNGLQGDDSEPHLSLARVAINLPPKLDSLFKVDIGKSMIDPPADFAAALESGKEAPPFKKFLRDAEDVYRHQKKNEAAKFKFTGGTGFPASVRKKLLAALSEKGLPRPKEVAVAWVRLPADELFRVEPGSNQIAINKSFQALIEKRSPETVSLLKALLLLLLQDELSKAFLTESARDRVERMNRALLSTISQR